MTWSAELPREAADHAEILKLPFYSPVDHFSDCPARPGFMDKSQKSLFDLTPEPWELDAADDRLVVTVVLPEPPYGPFDYRVGESLRDHVEPGRRVEIPLGRGNRLVQGYIVRISDATVPRLELDRGQLKEVVRVVDAEPLLSSAMLRLTEWMADYYLCPWGQVLEGAVPSGVRAQAGTRQVQWLRIVPVSPQERESAKLTPKQEAALRHIAQAATPQTLAAVAAAVGCGPGPVQALVRKGLLSIQRARLMPTEQVAEPVSRTPQPDLNSDQATAFAAVREALLASRHETILVHGVTGSGKTELYMRAMEAVVSFRRQAIVLVPEISLTPQTVARFRARFSQVAVLHSHLSPTERHAQWRLIAAGEVPVVVGARSAIFAPTPYLGLIVIDEEHDASFKQDSVPRYHAREVALERARQEQVPVLLGSATPSLESWQAALDGRFRLVEMPRRILDRPLPAVKIVDMRDERRNPNQRGAIGRQLYLAMRQTLQEHGQIILLLNRRGFATSIQCPACGYVARCPHCDLPLTHHRTNERAICHYCEYETAAPLSCPECRFGGLRFAGLGTQRLEAEVRARFPQVSLLRMDSDTMDKPGSHEAAFQRFREREVQILLGTQMIAKGLDFPDVTLVGVIQADSALHFPDFRAAERTFQLVTQVAGRTGRGERGGRVLVQTLSPDHPAIVAASRHDYRQFAQDELPLRSEMGYPPFGSLVRLILRGPVEKDVEQFADALGRRLEQEIAAESLPVRMLGPAPAPISKLRGHFRFHLLLQGPEGATLRRLARTADQGLDKPADVQWLADVDPLDMQ